jgi:2-C-methyl-D-erythritol 4-phosphate cytidylyltransferase
MAVALIVAAGSGERLGAGVPKALVELAGRPMWLWSLDALARCAAVEQIVIAWPPEIASTQASLAERLCTSVGIESVEGGASRSESVLRALRAARSAEIVLVHDAARPLLTPELAESVISALSADPDAHAAIAAAAVTDTIKRADASLLVSETLPRNELWSVQTPQVFRREALERALGGADTELALATDDASLIERSGGRVIVVPSSPENIKVTTPVDLRLAGLLLAARHGPSA